MRHVSLMLPDEPTRLVEPALLDDLTEREIQTLALIANGLSNKLIARDLGISDGTVKVYVRNLLRKFRLGSRLELAAWVHRHGAGLDPLESSAKPAVASASTVQVAGDVLGGTLLDELPGLIYRGDNNPR